MQGALTQRWNTVLLITAGGGGGTVTVLTPAYVMISGGCGILREWTVGPRRELRGTAKERPATLRAPHLGVKITANTWFDAPVWVSATIGLPLVSGTVE